MFTIPNKRSSYALTEDVAKWIAEQRLNNEIKTEGADIEKD